ncbi:hypothetical protein J4Q44_G00179450 [Coregonus suidteri]|uniref:Coagulation factor X n=1 Tax=Coregonus suidteri TaxID=861788 RepID=A0AAN8LWP2_9TELE
MGYIATAATLLSLLLLGAVTARLDTKNTKTVFLDKQEASEVITLSRQKRANVGNEESLLPANLERECLEEVCNYEEAREIFQDSYRTDIFWSVYIDGDQCAEKPCKNGAMCSDSVGGYDCVCKSGFFGVHCETDQTVCMLDKTKGCSQFCKPGYQSYECSCARGWKLEEKERVKCIPAVTFPCGKVNSLSQWTKRQSANIASNFEGLACNSGECPWQAILKSAESVGFCSGVILKENLVLTTAQCAQKYINFQVAVGKRQTASEDGEQTMYVKSSTSTPVMYPVALTTTWPSSSSVVLMTGEYPAVVTGWKDPVDATEVQGPLTLNHLAYEHLPQCVERHPGLVTNKMGCTTVRPNGDCILGPGSPILSLHREVFYLTGVVSRPTGADCSQGYIYQKVSRFLLWLQPLMDSR